MSRAFMLNRIPAVPPYDLNNIGSAVVRLFGFAMLVAAAALSISAGSSRSALAANGCSVEDWIGVWNTNYGFLIIEDGLRYQTIRGVYGADFGSEVSGYLQMGVDGACFMNGRWQSSRGEINGSLELSLDASKTPNVASFTGTRKSKEGQTEWKGSREIYPNHALYGVYVIKNHKHRCKAGTGRYLTSVFEDVTVSCPYVDERKSDTERASLWFVEPVRGRPDLYTIKDATHCSVKNSNACGNAIAVIQRGSNALITNTLAEGTQPATFRIYKRDPNPEKDLYPSLSDQYEMVLVEGFKVVGWGVTIFPTEPTQNAEVFLSSNEPDYWYFERPGPFEYRLSTNVPEQIVHLPKSTKPMSSRDELVERCHDQCDIKLGGATSTAVSNQGAAGIGIGILLCRLVLCEISPESNQ